MMRTVVDSGNSMHVTVKTPSALKPNSFGAPKLLSSKKSGSAVLVSSRVIEHIGLTPRTVCHYIRHTILTNQNQDPQLMTGDRKVPYLQSVLGWEINNYFVNSHFIWGVKSNI